MNSVYVNSALYHRPPPRKRRLRNFFVGLGVLLVLLLVTSGVLYALPVAAVKPRAESISVVTGQPPKITWPDADQAAIGADGYGVLDETNTDKAVPTASTAKIFTALMVLRAKPLTVGQEGPTITFTHQDELIANAYAKKQGVIFPVKAGQTMSQLNVMRAMMIISANNLADKLATWAYGSVDNYAKEATSYVQSAGLTKTHIQDASGFSPQTVSTAYDLVRAANMLLEDPVLAKVVDTPSATIGGYQLRSTNKLLDKDGVIGIKTGNTDEAGGCFVIARKVPVGGSSITVTAAIMGADNVMSAMAEAKNLTSQTKDGFSYKTLLPKSATVATFDVPWGQSVQAIAQKEVRSIVWGGEDIKVNLKLDSLKSAAGAGTNIGSVTLQNGADKQVAPVVLHENLLPPPITWRLYRRYLARL